MSPPNPLTPTHQGSSAGLTNQQKLLVGVLILALATWYAVLGVATHSAYTQAKDCLEVACPPGPVTLDAFLQDAINGLGTAFTAALGILLGINVAWANAQRQGAVVQEQDRQYLKAAWNVAGFFVLSLAVMIVVRLVFSFQKLEAYWPTTLDNLLQTILLIIIAAVGGVTTLAVSSSNDRMMHDARLKEKKQTEESAAGQNAAPPSGELALGGAPDGEIQAPVQAPAGQHNVDRIVATPLPSKNS